jgi:hypothetical protein
MNLETQFNGESGFNNVCKVTMVASSGSELCAGRKAEASFVVRIVAPSGYRIYTRHSASRIRDPSLYIF